MHDIDDLDDSNDLQGEGFFAREFTRIDANEEKAGLGGSRRQRRQTLKPRVKP